MNALLSTDFALLLNDYLNARRAFDAAWMETARLAALSWCAEHSIAPLSCLLNPCTADLDGRSRSDASGFEITARATPIAA